MILTRTNLIYFGVALLIGVCFSFGISSITYQPVPLQVTENPYAPAIAPTPAVTVLAPQYVPGSYADANKNTSSDPYAPAPAPVIVTTAPLPSITPIPVASSSNKCNGGLSPEWNQTLQNVNSQTQYAFSALGILPILIIVVGIIMIIVGAFGSADSYTVSSPFNTETTQAASSAASAFGGGGAIGMIIAVGGVLVALYIIAVVVGSITAGITNYGCIP
jgi:hypothetical protein